MKALAISLLTMALTCHAQAMPTTPTIKGHTLGETLEQFTTESNDVTRGQMQNCVTTDGKDTITWNANEGKFNGDSGSRCNEFLPTLKTGSGSFDCQDMAWENPEFDQQVCHNFEGRVTFDGGKLVELDIKVLNKDWDDVLPDVMAKFGKPDEVHVDTTQNAYGAKFDLHTASWTKPDYLVAAVEGINLHYDHPKYTVIVLEDRSYFQSQEAKKAHGNALN